LKLFSLNIEPHEYPETYYRASENVTCDGRALIVPDGEEIFFDCYYNLFSLKYVNATGIKDITAVIKTEGKFEFRIMLCTADGEKTIAETAGEGEISLTASVEGLSKQGYIYPVARSVGGGKILGGYYSAEKSARNIKIAVVICTYRREKYVYSNLNKMASYFNENGYLKEHFDILVIDNGGTLTEPLPIGKAVKNRNLGGSGGFTRGLYETVKRKEFTHVVFMDDDVSFDCRIFEKTYFVLALSLSETLSVGGAMLEMERPYRMYENGAVWAGLRQYPIDHGLDIRKKESLMTVEKERKKDYNAWWYMCFPVAFAVKFGYPLPFFIKDDDIEYGLRCCKEILTVSGIAVRHESFDNKYSGELEYYIKRNELILNALGYKKFGLFKEIKKLISAIARQLVFQRYFGTDLVFKAYDDFLKGAEYFNSIDCEKLNTELRKIPPKTFGAEELEEMGLKLPESPYERPKKKRHFRMVLTLNGYLIPDFLYGKNKNEVRFINVSTRYPSEFYKVKKTVQYNPTTGRGFITELKRSELFKNGFRLLGTIIKFTFRYKKVRNDYRKNLAKICSSEEWERRFFGSVHNQDLCVSE